MSRSYSCCHEYVPFEAYREPSLPKAILTQRRRVRREGIFFPESLRGGFWKSAASQMHGKSYFLSDGVFAFRPLSEKQKRTSPLRPLRLCDNICPQTNRNGILTIAIISKSRTRSDSRVSGYDTAAPDEMTDGLSLRAHPRKTSVIHVPFRSGGTQEHCQKRTTYRILHSVTYTFP